MERCSCPTPSHYWLSLSAKEKNFWVSKTLRDRGNCEENSTIRSFVQFGRSVWVLEASSVVGKVGFSGLGRRESGGTEPAWRWQVGHHLLRSIANTCARPLYHLPSNRRHRLASVQLTSPQSISSCGRMGTPLPHLLPSLFRLRRAYEISLRMDTSGHIATSLHALSCATVSKKPCRSGSF